MSNEKKLNLFEKIQKVSEAVMNIEKDMTVGSGKYSYKAVSDQQVTLAVKKAEGDFGLVSIPVKQELISSETIKAKKKNGDEGITYVDNIKMTVRIINIENPEESIDIESFGKGVDSGDKGFGKASTYARKYALLNAYKIATGEDPDQFKSEEQTVASTPSERRVKVEQLFAENNDILIQCLQHFNVQTSEEISDKEINTIFNTYTKRGKI